MKKWLDRSIAAFLALAASAIIAHATGLFPGLPLLGGASYCAGSNIGSALTGSQCSSTVPAGAATFTGNEVIPSDAFGPLGWGPTNQGQYPQSQFLSTLQLGNGPLVVIGGTTGTTVPNGTAFYYVNTTATDPTITFPANPIEGQLLTVILGSGLTGGLTMAANVGQSCAPAACPQYIAGTTSSTSYEWRYSTSGATQYWFRFR